MRTLGLAGFWTPSGATGLVVTSNGASTGGAAVAWSPSPFQTGRGALNQVNHQVNEGVRKLHVLEKRRGDNLLARFFVVKLLHHNVFHLSKAATASMGVMRRRRNQQRFVFLKLRREEDTFPFFSGA